MILQVHVGKNLNYSVGSLRYSSDTGVNPIISDASVNPTTSDASVNPTTSDIGVNPTTSDASVNPTTSDTSETNNIIFAAIAAVMVLIIILLVVVIICVVRKKSKKRNTIAFTGNTDVNMYASPAYGTHQVFTEPGLDHLYEPTDEYCEENTTTLKDTTSPASDDDEIDAEGYLKMKPSCEVVGQATTESSVAADTCSTFIGSKPTDEYIQALDINLPASSIKDDDDDGKGDDKNDDDKDKDDDVKGDDKDNVVKGDDKDDDIKGDDEGDDRKADHDDNNDSKGDDKNYNDYDNNDQKP